MNDPYKQDLLLPWQLRSNRDEMEQQLKASVDLTNQAFRNGYKTGYSEGARDALNDVLAMIEAKKPKPQAG